MREDENTKIARVVHEANRAWNVALEDPAPDGPWDTLSGDDKKMVTDRVQMIRDGATPMLIHQAWVHLMLGKGWQLGDVKDPAADPPTHTCLKPYSELPEDQQKKDNLAWWITRCLTQSWD